MSLKCQKDSYAQTLTSKVVSCVPSKYEDKECYETILEDTVLYPEGGGQPDDRGKVTEDVVHVCIFYHVSCRLMA